jgi:hypothetical protein
MRKCYPLWAGISLSVKYQVGEDCHEVQLWEETPNDTFIRRNQAEEVYKWLMDKIRDRSSQGMIPEDMPLSIEGTTVQTWKDGKGGYILFTPKDTLSVPVGVWEVQVTIEYESGYTRIGMGNAYTIQMLADEFLTITQRQWRIFPLNDYRRLTDGTVVHRVTNDEEIFRAVTADQELQELPPKILEE